jgi:glycosyltransferase involved in cell wall biosynthesis
VKRALVTLAHPNHAGMLRALAVLDKAAPAHGWRLDYVFAAPDPLVAAEGLPLERVSYLPALRRWRRSLDRVTLPLAVARLAARARGADVFYSTTLSSFPYCLFAGRLARTPQVVHVYSSYAEPEPYRKHLLARARHVIAPSADSLALASRAIGGFKPAVRARVIYNGMDIPRLARQAAEALPAGVVLDGRPTIGMVGNLDARKNPALLVEALPAVRAAVPSVRALLIGGFPDATYAARVDRRIAELGLRDAVTVTGFLPNPFPVVKALDVVVHPALRDPFPLALLEAMALDKPIVAAAVGGIPEMLEDGVSGLLFPSGDAGALAKALVELLERPARRAQVGAAAGARLASRFSLAGFAAAMFAAFDDAAADR